MKIFASLMLVAMAGLSAEESAFPFFAYCIDTHDSIKRSLADQATMLKELGYNGVGHLWLENVKERLETIESVGLRLFQITLRVDLSSSDTPYDVHKLQEVLPLLAGKQVQLCLIVAGGAPSDESLDDVAVPIIRSLATMAAPYGVEILLYPHVSDWLERVEDAIRIARKVGHPNVGIMFNLCHWLKVDKEENLKPLLISALPFLRAVSINGADHAAAIREGTGNWIQPLDSGTYDVGEFLVSLKELGYNGPVGLQCWGIEGDARDHLSRSMTAWKALQKRLHK